MAKSWSATKKILESEMLCESLQGRVKYYFTLFRKSHDQAGLFQVKVDGKTLFQATPFNERHKDDIFTDLAAEHNATPTASWDDYDEAYDVLEALVEQKAADQGLVDSYFMNEYIHKYLNQSIQDSLEDPNPVIRMFAILDRRVGARTLHRMQDAGVLEQQPEWLKSFYELRGLKSDL